jgi:predicted nucleotidyltransferase
MPNDINEVEAKDISLASFKIRDDLNPKFWVNGKLNSRVRLKLLDIADDFIDELNIKWVKPKDIVLTGSIANYNWSKFSDVDVHILVNYKDVFDKKDIVGDYFSAKKEIWGETHPNLTIYGYPVEVYVEDAEEKQESSGIYSLNSNKWIVEPNDFQDAKINEKYVKKYAAEIMTDIDNIIAAMNKETRNYKLETLSNKLLKIFDKLKRLRKDGLKSKQKEMSSGNIIWKILRRTKYLEKLFDNINRSYDKANSLK